MTQKRRLFWMLFFSLLASLLIGALSLELLICRTHAPAASEALVSPVGFPFLALIIAFSVYLRQVASGADEKREKILRGEVSLYPLGTSYTKEKLEALNGTHDKLTAVAPFLIWLSLIIIARLFFDSLTPFRFPWFETMVPVLHLVDFLLLEWLFLIFIMLGIFHLFASRRDERLRGQAFAAYKLLEKRQTETLGNE